MKKHNTALETDEGQLRLAEYHFSLGKFVDQFARVESAVAICLMWHAKITQARARAIFSGVRAEAASGHLRRLAVIKCIRPDEWRQLCPVLTQLGHLNSARNLILHYGGRDVASGGGYATDARSALLAEKIRNIPISSTILEEMTADLRKIYAHIALRHCGRVRLHKQFPQAVPLLSVAWQYKPPQPAQKNRQKKRLGSEGKGQRRQPLPSQDSQ